MAERRNDLKSCALPGAPLPECSRRQLLGMGTLHRTAELSTLLRSGELAKHRQVFRKRSSLTRFAH